MINSATPPQMKPVVSVTTTSGMREKTTIRPLIAPWAAPATMISTASNKDSPKLAFSIVAAARTLETAMTEPIDRSMPPATTTTVCAAAANASGRAPMASD